MGDWTIFKGIGKGRSYGFSQGELAGVTVSYVRVDNFPTTHLTGMVLLHTSFISL